LAQFPRARHRQRSAWSDIQLAGVAPYPPAGEPISVEDRASYLLTAHCSLLDAVYPLVGARDLEFASADDLLRPMTAVFKTEQASAHTCGFKAGPAGVGVDSADVALCMVAADASGVGLDKPVGASHPAYQEIIQAVRDEVLLKPHHTGTH